MRIPSKTSQSGFTLVEIAIVLVIIGLLLGGVLKGTELIENSKVKRAVGEINGISAAYYSYVDRYQRIPGDDGPALADLTARGGTWSSVTAFGNNNGALAAALNNFLGGTGEHAAFWQHLRAAGLVTGDATSTGVNALPRNSFGGLIGVTSAAVATNLQGLKVCLTQVPGKSAMALDAQLDDGVGATGRTRATDGTAGTNTAPTNVAIASPYSEDNYYTVCTQI